MLPGDLLVFSDTTVERLTNRRVVGTSFACAVAVAAFLISHWGQHALGITPTLASVVTVIWLSDLVLFAFIARPIAVDPAFAWVRLLFFANRLLIAFVYGAASDFELSPAWLFCVPVLVLIATLRPHRAPAVLVLTAASPLVLRLLLAHAPSTRSLFAAAVVGVGSAALLGWLSRRHDALASASTPQRLDHEERALRRQLLDAVSPSLSLHDWLSGPLLAARTQLDAAREYAEASRSVETVLQLLGPLVDGRAKASAGPWTEELTHLLAPWNVSVRVKTSAGAEQLPSAEQAVLASLARDAAYDLARRHDGAQLELAADADADAVSVTLSLREREGVAERTGRSLRNLRFRVWTFGGAVEPLAEGGLRVRWPRRHGARSWGLVAVGAVAFAVLAAVLSHDAESLVMLTVVCMSTAVVAGPVAAARRNLFLSSTVPVLEQRVSARLAAARESLRAAHVAGSVAEVRVALDRLGAEMAEALIDAEEHGLPSVVGVDHRRLLD